MNSIREKNLIEMVEKITNATDTNSQNIIASFNIKRLIHSLFQQ